MSSSKLITLWKGLFFLFSYYASYCLAHPIEHWPVGGLTRFYDFKVQTTGITKLCKSKQIITINGKFPGPVITANEDDRIIVKVTNETPQNATIHWHGVMQRLTCWADGPVYVTQCPIRPGETYTYEFTMVGQRGTFFWHAHVSWLRATVHGALVVYPKRGVPYPFPHPYEEHILVLGEYFFRNAVKLERAVLASGGGAPRADAYIINAHPGPRYNCSATDVETIDVVPGKTYLLRLINAGLNNELFFSIANHKLTIVESDAEYTKPFTPERLMIAPGQTINVLVKADQPIGKYEMAVGPYMSAQNVPFQNISAVAHFQYSGASLTSLSQPAQLPAFNDNLAVKSHMDGLRSLNATYLPLEIDSNLFFTIGLNENQCNRKNPNRTCQAPNRGIFAAAMNNISFVRPSLSLLQAYYYDIQGYYTPNFPKKPLKIYDFVYGAPNNAPIDTSAMKGTKVTVLEFGTKVQLVLQDTGTITTENHPMHLHGYSFYVVGYGTGNYNPLNAKLNLVDPPYMNTFGVPVGGWAAIRFVANNPGVWFLHCHLDLHLSWGFSMAFIVKNGEGPLETLPHPPADLPKC
ncbi:laccase-6-like isoform X1 [Iris pallida]|uniref:Laccase n=1 Tax=Iris pallida TaxID=29817 RepID=A0AAX6GWT1_IRIPA|nr:laccase-6-like isoform X1 [Iris pallida]KAJ6833216.1 laccase-6-like isoform X1 [Iris pallida]